ncbi:CNT family concentrative nucleoside transporter [Sphingomonas sp. PP-CE-1A-559]|jgi:CNT family concentrative nucleoside transporter|uniref:NupC/NupG family nucleoside CNT transporter n=1 Tax=unclassified Sphingomonas TaxID=196159 RepID=UPI0006F24653|nr:MULTISPECIES: nucleoside transporter C-terminal domain-containing protein [unclassified Sphingomonas]KQM49036.1 nucleoside transporter [Sphingomonas sp. Leaf208]RKE43638.1 CNT family concentrative nucleoside transporter [Sphingomonas sp. PP-CC-1A-547]TCM05864.1 CNT family concentrative nucleoside transporter [Sphingomonas sp. PP-CC-3G-468]TCP91451.1 CNT family concentrative nucleoside transporter [Sphingomonas sp. PP-CE-1A-559]
MERLFIGLAGIAVILGIAVLLSSDRRAIRLRIVGAAFALQAGIAVLVLYSSFGKVVLGEMSGGVANLLGYSQKGTEFLFGKMATPEIGGQSFAIAALPVIIFFASLVSILYYLGIMQFVVRWVGGGIEKVIGVSKVESLCAAANIFVGQSESPLVIRPYLAGLTPAQLFTVMTSGMAGVAGTILAAYASMGIRIDYLLAASFMAAPGGILMAKIIMPDRVTPPEGELALGDLPGESSAGEPMPQATHDEEKPANLIMAAAQGAQTGVRLAVAVGAMVLAFVALVALANGLLGGLGNMIGLPGLSFQGLLGYVFAPIMFLLNVPWSEAGIAGGLFGQKIVLNEFVAYISLGTQQGLSPRTIAVITFSLCGFANFSSIAIQMAVTGSLAPNQRPMIAKLGLRALAAGSLANLMSAALAGLLIG